MKKADFISNVYAARQEFNSIVDGLTVDQMLQPGVCGEWSVKDLVAHIAWYEREMISVLETHALTGSDLWDLTLEQRNAAIYAVNKDRLLRDVLTEARLVSVDLVRLLPTLSEADLNDASGFPGMPFDWQPWQVIASNTYEHYADHLGEIRKVFGK